MNFADLVRRAAHRPPHVLAWKLWERIRRRRDRRLTWSSPEIRCGREKLLSDLGSRFFCASGEIDETVAVLAERDPAWRAGLEASARNVLDRRFPILGAGTRDVGKTVRWSTDYRSGLSFPDDVYGFEQDILDFGRPTDVRVVWELNRLHELVTLGRAYRATRKVEYFRDFRSLMTSWLEYNPVARSVNWSCAMEAAIRAVNLLWAISLFLPCDEFDDHFVDELLSAVEVHGRFIRRNIEWNDLRNNHYLSDLLGLLIIGTYLPESRESRGWVRYARRRLEREAAIQINRDGTDYEGSIPYQQLVAEIYLTAAANLSQRGEALSAATRARVEKMLEFVAAYTKPNGRAPLIGDGDDGRFVVLGPQSRGDHRHLLSTGGVLLGRPDLVAAAGGIAEETMWLLGSRAAKAEAPVTPRAAASAAFPEGGIYVMRAGETHLVVDAGDVGLRGRGAHGHHDALSFELVLDGREIVIDSGTASYTADRAERVRVLSAAAHNVPVVDGADAGPVDAWGFVQAHSVPVRVVRWSTGDGVDEIVAEHDGYAPVVIRRRIALDKLRGRVTIEDRADGRGSHRVEIAFHLHPECSAEVSAETVVITSGDRRFALRASGGKEWSLDPAIVYLEYAVGTPSVRAVYTFDSVLPAAIQFDIEPI